jgi:hypothetical protein
VAASPLSVPSDAGEGLAVQICSALALLPAWRCTEHSASGYTCMSRAAHVTVSRPLSLSTTSVSGSTHQARQAMLQQLNSSGYALPCCVSSCSSAARRDFTINALYYDPASGRVLDFVGGVADAQQRILRLTGGHSNLTAFLSECCCFCSIRDSSCSSIGQACACFPCGGVRRRGRGQTHSRAS